MIKREKLDAVKFGLAAAIVTAICMFLITIAGIYNYCPECVSLIFGIYSSFGYSVSWFGAVLGAIYGAIDMFIFTWLFALIYNKLL